MSDLVAVPLRRLPPAEQTVRCEWKFRCDKRGEFLMEKPVMVPPIEGPDSYRLCLEHIAEFLYMSACESIVI